jgi:putative DNA methylase
MKDLLIEKWFPVREVSIESGRERGGANMLPPLYFLHLWWARRPQSASRIASVLACLPREDLGNEEKKRLLWALGLRGDPLAAIARREKGEKSFGYPVLEGVQPEPKVYLDRMIKLWGRRPVGADFMAGGGSIPFEMVRAGFGEVVAGEYNPVAYIILKASLEYPIKYGDRLVSDVKRYGEQLLADLRRSVAKYFPRHPLGQPIDYVWVRMFRCPECGIDTPSLKSLWLDKDKGYAIYPVLKEDGVNLNVVRVEEVGKVRSDGGEHSRVRITDGEYTGTVFETRGYERGGELECPRHRHTIPENVVKEQYKMLLAQREQDGYHGSHPARLVAAVLEGRVYVEPSKEMIDAYVLAEEDLKRIWNDIVEADLVPLEIHGKGESDRVVEYGLDAFHRMFTSRQLLVHAEIVRLIREAHDRVAEDEVRKGRSRGEAEEYAKAIATYLTLVSGKTLDYNSTLTMWHESRGAISPVFDTHAFGWTWDFGEGDMIHDGKALSEWALKNVLKALRGIAKRTHSINPDVRVVYGDASQRVSIDMPKGGYDIVFVDPPYYGNVQYGEISDYFYVWFKKTLGSLYPEAFAEPETPKQEEAVANRVRHGSAKLASQRYEGKMREIFASVHKSLQDEGVFLLWFAHKAGAAWIRTVRALLDSGFGITAMWGVRSEMARSLHITGKAALRTSIIMVCRKQSNGGGGYIQDAVQELDKALEPRLTELEEYGLMGPDFLMGAQAEALRVASHYWPLKDPSGTIGSDTLLDLVLDQATGIAVNHITRRVAPQILGIDTVTKFYILAKHLYSDIIPYDEARRLALACLGGSGTGDPVEEVVVKSGLGRMTVEQVTGERAKVVRLTTPWERAREGRLFQAKPTSTIDWVHAAVAGLEEGRRLEEVAVHIAKGGSYVCEVVKVLYHVLPETVPDSRGKPSRNREKLHIQALLLGVCQEGLHLTVQQQLQEKEAQKRLDQYQGKLEDVAYMSQKEEGAKAWYRGRFMPIQEVQRPTEALKEAG